MRLIGKTSRRASRIESATAPRMKAVISSTVFQIFPRRGAKVADSGCSTNTFQSVEGTGAQALKTFRWRRFSPVADPTAWPERRAACTCGSASLFGKTDQSPPNANLDDVSSRSG